MKTLSISGLGLITLLILALPFSVAHAEETKISVIVLYKEKITKVDIDNIKERHGEIKKTWKIIDGLATDLLPIDIEELKKDPSVLAVEPDFPVYALDLTTDQQILADKVWDDGNIGGDSSSRVPVAILDTGIDNTHPEFAGRITLCHSEITNSNTCQDQHGHGTHVAGIVGAIGINSTAKGVAPGVQYYIDQVLDRTGSGSFSGIISGIDWAVANNAKVISMSLGSNTLVITEPNCDSQFISLRTAINNAVNAGVTVIAAAGNSGTNGVAAPGCMSNVIAVTAVNSNDVIASFSSKGKPVKDHGIAAPGVNIFSTFISHTYTTLSGTSMATPAVSGVVALLLQTNPNLTPAQVKNTLFTTACTTQTNPSCQTGSVPNTSYGYGRVNALAAYNKIKNIPDPCERDPRLSSDSQLLPCFPEIDQCFSSPPGGAGICKIDFAIFREVIDRCYNKLVGPGCPFPEPIAKETLFKIQQKFPPLKQVKAGIDLNDIVPAKGKVLLMNNNRLNPISVTEKTAESLLHNPFWHKFH